MHYLICHCQKVFHQNDILPAPFDKYVLPEESAALKTQLLVAAQRGSIIGTHTQAKLTQAPLITQILG